MNNYNIWRKEYIMNLLKQNNKRINYLSCYCCVILEKNMLKTHEIWKIDFSVEVRYLFIWYLNNISSIKHYNEGKMSDIILIGKIDRMEKRNSGGFKGKGKTKEGMGKWRNDTFKNQATIA